MPGLTTVTTGGLSAYSSNAAVPSSGGTVAQAKTGFYSDGYFVQNVLSAPPAGAGIYKASGEPLNTDKKYYSYSSNGSATLVVGDVTWLHGDLYAFGSGTTDPSQLTGRKSIYLGTSGRFRVPPSDSGRFEFMAGDFTIECFYKLNASKDFGSIVAYVPYDDPNIPGYTVSLGWDLYWSGYSGPRFKLDQDGSATWSIDGDYFETVLNPPNQLNPNNTYGVHNVNGWNHVAVCRAGNTVSIYLNGVKGQQKTVSGTIPALIKEDDVWSPADYATIHISAPSGALRIGGSEFSGDEQYPGGLPDNRFGGQISNLRIVKGQALYSGSTYTVPNSPLNLSGYGTVSQNITGTITFLGFRTQPVELLDQGLVKYGAIEYRDDNPFS